MNIITLIFIRKNQWPGMAKKEQKKEYQCRIICLIRYQNIIKSLTQINISLDIHKYPWSRIRNPEINHNMYENSIYDKCGNSIRWESYKLFNMLTLTGYPFRRK